MKTKTLALFMVLSLASCDWMDPADDNTIVLSEKAAKLVDVNNQFGFDLFKDVYQYEKEAENLMVSPTSVALALAMTYNGAEGSTKEAMEKTLRLHGLTSDEINQSYKSLVDGLKSLDKKVLLEIANAIFYREGFSVEETFVTTNRTFYNAEVSPLNFSLPKALETINGWVNDKTRTKIPSIIDEISPDHVMFLLNAIYFKGSWAKEFNKEGTAKQPFYGEGNQIVDAMFMSRLDTLDYLKNELFSAIRLPYGSGNYNMYVFLPEPSKSLSEMVAELNKENWSKWMGDFKTTKSVQIMLPRFKYPYEIKLNDVLTEMGMGIAFSGAADFTGINRHGGLCIDYVKHKTFIEVNEEGTEAAAVTIVAIRKLSTEDMPTYTPFYANRPFLYAITEKSTGAILFLGTVKKPTE